MLLPDLEGRKLDQRREGLAVQKTPERSVEWVLDLPSEIFREHDPVLAALWGTAEAEACYEKLSLLYVAMTRAKRAMYVITEPAGTSKSRNYPRVLADALGAEAGPVPVGALVLDGAWSSGEADWHMKLAVPAEPMKIPEEIALINAVTAVRAPRRLTRRPKRQEKTERSGERRRCSRSRAHGAAVLARRVLRVAGGSGVGERRDVGKIGESME